jgi:cytochrome c oxidase cbb3-type subunit 3
MSESQDQDRLLDHEYDGIHEYDNPMPRWWLATLWGTVIFAVLYALNVIPGLGSGPGRIVEYEAAVAAGDSVRAAHNPVATIDEAGLLAAARDPAKLAAGRETFATTCSPCHAADGGGNIGPNLTDAYWIHGGKPMDILHTVDAGVLDKGMPAWGQSLNPEQVIAVAAYVTTLRGTTPAAPKAPQGTLDSAAAVPDARPGN